MFVVIVTFLSILSFIDCKMYKISEEIFISLLIIVTSFYIKTCYEIIIVKFIIGLIFFIIFSIIAVCTKGLGFGDVKIISLLGFITSFFKNLFICFVASLLGIIYFLIEKANKKTHEKIAFVPFLTMGYIVIEIFARFV